MARIALISLVFSLIAMSAFAQAPIPSPTASPKPAPISPPSPSPSPTKVSPLSPSPSPSLKSPVAAPAPSTPSPANSPTSFAAPPSFLNSPPASAPGVSDNSACSGFSSFAWISVAAMAVACAL